MTTRHVQVRITRERTGRGDLVAEVACPGCGARCCRPLLGGLTAHRCPACQSHGGFPVAMGLGPGEQIPCPRCHGSGREVTA